jgi:hypothetical protein
MNKWTVFILHPWLPSALLSYLCCHVFVSSVSMSFSLILMDSSLQEPVVMSLSLFSAFTLTVSNLQVPVSFLSATGCVLCLLFYSASVGFLSLSFFLCLADFVLLSSFVLSRFSVCLLLSLWLYTFFVLFFSNTLYVWRFFIISLQQFVGCG